MPANTVARPPLPLCGGQAAASADRAYAPPPHSRRGRQLPEAAVPPAANSRSDKCIRAHRPPPPPLTTGLPGHVGLTRSPPCQGAVEPPTVTGAGAGVAPSLGSRLPAPPLAVDGLRHAADQATRRVGPEVQPKPHPGARLATLPMRRCHRCALAPTLCVKRCSSSRRGPPSANLPRSGPAGPNWAGHWPGSAHNRNTPLPPKSAHGEVVSVLEPKWPTHAHHHPLLPAAAMVTVNA